MAEVQAEVHVQIAGEDVPAGRLWAHRGRGAESATFAYLPEYLSRPDAYELDPTLQLFEGQQQTAAGRALFGAFTDCAPDRWGRRLIAGTEHDRAHREGGAERNLAEIDYLLEVRDDLRQGAIRFRDPDTGIYRAEEDSGVPLLVGLPKLINAAESLERDQASEEELQILLRGGSSLGGARPKAHVVDTNGRIAIAKFPSPTRDEWDVIRWEAVALRLAEAAGVTVPAYGLHIVDGKPVLIVDRFDRVGDKRIGYVSAMTMLEGTDLERGSYLDIAGVIERQSPRATEDLKELWRRIAFSILISNTDDHLRNHGFLRSTSAGWSLAPAFDLNPDPRPGPKQLSTAIDFEDATASLDLLMEVAGLFRLDAAQGRQVVGEVHAAVDAWQTVAGEMGLDRRATEQMAPAFVAGERAGSLAAP